MGQRIFTMIVVVALAITLGIAIVAKQARQPILREILTQQKTMLQGVARLEKKINEKPAMAAPMAAVTGGESVKIQALENRIAALETQLKTLGEALKNAAPAARPGPPPEDYTTAHDIPIDHSYVLGNKNAPVTIVEFSDFQCPFCARFHDPVKEVLKAYPKDVRLIIKNFPLSFHPQARPAAKAAFAAGEQGKYFEMVDKLLENQKQLSDQKFEELAKELKLDVKKFLKDYKERDAEWEAKIQKDMQLGAKVGVRGTPSYYLNGKKTRARDLAGYKREIDQILNK